MSQNEPQRNDPKPADRRAGGGRLSGAWVLALVLALAAGPPFASSARADTAGQAAQPASPVANERAEERAAKEATTEAVAEDLPDPAPVPEPPARTTGSSSDDEMLIELPIAPAGKRPKDPDEQDDAPALPTAPSEETAAVVNGADELESLRVLFSEGGIAINAGAEAELIGLAGYLSTNEAQRVVLHAYAGGDDQGGSDARRLSLSRALAIRSFLVDRGVAVERIHLRPLGSEIEDGPPDRVDILPLRP